MSTCTRLRHSGHGILARAFSYAACTIGVLFASASAYAELPQWYTQEDLGVDMVPYSQNARGQILGFRGSQPEGDARLRTFLLDPKQGLVEVAPPPPDQFISEFHICKPAAMLLNDPGHNLSHVSAYSSRTSLDDEGNAAIECLGTVRDGSLSLCGYAGSPLVWVRFNFSVEEGLVRRGGPYATIGQDCASRYGLSATSPSLLRGMSGNGLTVGRSYTRIPRPGVVDDMLQEFPAAEEISLDYHTEITAIDNSGDLAGFSRGMSSYPQTHGAGFVRRGGEEVAPLIIPGLTLIRPMGINSAGVIHGNGGGDSFVVRDGQVLLMNERIPATRWERVNTSHVTDVNENGVAAVVGTENYVGTTLSIPFLVDSATEEILALRESVRSFEPQHLDPYRMALGDQVMPDGHRMWFPSMLIDDENTLIVRGKRRGSQEYSLFRLTPHRVGQYPRGDVNCDGVLNNFDIDVFVMLLTQPQRYPAEHPNCDSRTGDLNGDGAVNNFDVDEFLELFQG
ncbi:MAG: hypothetical protein QY326_03390 [Bdellovibrionota bacterium]|nr:MAG: hypothetical protein QY326_03390 [Bdellovibrionota bacterium]